MSRQIRGVRSDLKSLVGMKFGRWTVLEHDIERSIDGKTFWKCQCECGTLKSVRNRFLNDGQSKSCGCLKKQKTSERTKTHGLTNHNLYHRWMYVKQRCGNPKNTKYKYYGGRGIKVCEEWDKDFMNFYNWSLANGYSKDLTLDRIDNNGDYSPDNCRYITIQAQQLNKRDSRYVEIEGETLTVKEWCDKTGINRNTFVRRLNHGWEGKDLIKPIIERK